MKVETRAGRVEGIRNGELSVFRGIPYAKPPVGLLRFRAPEPAASWSGVRDASAFGPAAPQAPVGLDGIPGMEVGEQGEDCLTLNVFTPGADADFAIVKPGAWTFDADNWCDQDDPEEWRLGAVDNACGNDTLSPPHGPAW